MSSHDVSSSTNLDQFFESARKGGQKKNNENAYMDKKSSAIIITVAEQVQVEEGIHQIELKESVRKELNTRNILSKKATGSRVSLNSSKHTVNLEQEELYIEESKQRVASLRKQLMGEESTPVQQMMGES